MYCTMILIEFNNNSNLFKIIKCELFYKSHMNTQASKMHKKWTHNKNAIKYSILVRTT
jgi:hypothetical protein